MKKNRFFQLLATLALFSFLLAIVLHKGNPDAISYESLLAIIDPAFPGWGHADYKDYPTAHVSKSYAMVLKAELNRQAHFGGDLSPKGRSAATWLLRNRGSEGEGWGWGLPFPWDAFGDGTVNPENTVYTISTGIVVDALIDWIETDPHAPAEEVLSILKQVLEPFAQGAYNSSNGLVAYSSSPHDAKFDCFNPAAYLAGQMQRLAQIHPDRRFAALLKQRADANFKILLEYKRISPGGAWYWNYSTAENVPNDMAHAVYIMHGIRSYMRFDGTLKDQFDLARISSHVHEFKSKTFHAWPVFRVDLNPNPPPRLYDFSNLIAYLVGEPSVAAGYEASALIAQFAAYRRMDGRYAARPGDGVAINEYEAFMLHAVSLAYFRDKFRQGSGFSWKPHRMRDVSRTGKLPLTDFSTSNHDVSFRPGGDFGKGELVIDGGIVPIDGLIPLKIEEVNPTRLLLFARRALSEPLLLIPLEKGRKNWKRKAMIALPASLHNAVFRASARWNGTTVAVVFAFRENANSIILLPDEEFESGIAPRVMPFRIHDPLGYEHQPHVLLKPAGNTLYLASGPSVCQLTTNLSCWTLPPWARVLEIDADGQRALALVQQRDQPVFRLSERAAKPTRTTHQVLYDIATRTALRSYGPNETVFGLRLDGKHIHLTKANLSRETLARAFFLDWSLLGNSGILSFGIDNLNGNVAWSQSYYLSGLLDALAPGHAPWAAETRVLRARLDREAKSLLALMRTNKSLQCSLFSADRAPVTHAAQTGKILLFLKRFLQSAGNQGELRFLQDYALRVATLQDHVEEFSGPPESKNSTKYRHLGWRYGANFPYDGTALPFNHQNLWAAGILYELATYPVPPQSIAVAKEVVQILLEEEGLLGVELRKRVAQKDRPEAYYWRYWWGIARSGWGKDQQVSVNTESFAGDKDSVALSRYRTFDAIATLVAMAESAVPVDREILGFFAKGVEAGELELFLTPFLEKLGIRPVIPDDILLRDLRFDSQPDLRNSVSSLFLLAGRLQ